jgi:hypothetical protein
LKKICPPGNEIAFWKRNMLVEWQTNPILLGGRLVEQIKGCFVGGSSGWWWVLTLKIAQMCIV